MSNLTLTRFPTGSEASLDKFGWIDWWARIVDTLNTWNRRHKTRRHLARVEHHVLRDIGISEADRFIESNKPFWEE